MRKLKTLKTLKSLKTLMSLKSLETLMTLLLLASCSTDDLCYDHPHESSFEVIFDWSDAPDATPAGMRVWFYPQTGRQSAAPYFTDLSAQGGKVDIIGMNYHVIAHNNDSEWLTFDGTDSYHTHTVTTRTGGLLEPMGTPYRSVSLRSDNDDDRIAVAPDPAYAIGHENVIVSPSGSITMRPQPLCCRYTYEFRNVGSLKHVSRVSAAISGMADGVNIAAGEQTTTTCTIPLEATLHSDTNSITGSFYTFGHHPKVATPHRMALYVVLDDGRQLKYVSGDYLDVTDQIHNAPDPFNVHLVIEGLQVPTAIENGNGFNVGLDDWEEINHDLTL